MVIVISQKKKLTKHFKMNFLILLVVFVHSVTSNPCPQWYGGCGQAQVRCPPNYTYSNGVCVMQQYVNAQQPYSNFIQGPSSCGSNAVLYNGGCQSQGVATCPYASTLQNGLCNRNEPSKLIQPYSMDIPQSYQTYAQQPYTSQSMMNTDNMQHVAQPLPQPMQGISQPVLSEWPKSQVAGQEIQQTITADRLTRPVPQSTLQSAQPLPQPFQFSQSLPQQSMQLTQGQPMHVAQPLPQPMNTFG